MTAAVLVPTKYVLKTNVSDGEILSNLRASKERNLPYVDICPKRDRPLAIVGSGPSVLSRLEYLRAFPGDIMALNGAYNLLLDNGITPKYAVLIDARPENTNFFEHPSLDTFHLLASQVHPQVYEYIADRSGKVATFHLDGPAFQSVFEPGEVTCMGGMHTVGLTALILATTLGYRNLHLYGYDSSYSGGKSHALPQAQNEGQETTEVEFLGKWYTTTPAMASQTEHFFLLKKVLFQHYPDLDLYLCGDGLFYDFINGNNRETTPEDEVAKYAHLYDHDDYGMTQARHEAIKAVLPKVPVWADYSLLDVGTGRGETLEIADFAGYQPVYGTETVDKLLNDRVVKAVLPKLPFPDKSIDVVTCFEVLEHIHPNDLENSIKELARVARRTIVVSVCTLPDIRGGVNLHPSAQPVEKWEALLALTGGRVTRVGEASIQPGVSPIYKVDL
jgi:SAM-dependent methyltransferase